jgi:hypothetical protein
MPQQRWRMEVRRYKMGLWRRAVASLVGPELSCQWDWRKMTELLQ